MAVRERERGKGVIDLTLDDDKEDRRKKRRTGKEGDVDDVVDLACDDAKSMARKRSDCVGEDTKDNHATRQSISSRSAEKDIYGFKMLRLENEASSSSRSMEGDDDVTLKDLLFIDDSFVWDEVVVENFMIDGSWLVNHGLHHSSQPNEEREYHDFSRRFWCNHVKRLLIIHGTGTESELLSVFPKNARAFKPLLPISYGTHHSKLFILCSYTHGLRIIIHTANLILQDILYKNQGVYTQDFPPLNSSANDDRTNGNSHTRNDFADTLLAYFSSMRMNESSRRHVDVVEMLQKFDLSGAAVKLIASTPGYHTNRQVHSWGHMALRRALSRESFKPTFKGAQFTAQFSSIGSIYPKWMNEFKNSVSMGKIQNTSPPEDLGSWLGPDKEGLFLIWPTVEQVRTSIEGYSGGNSVPGFKKNVDRDFLKPLWSLWSSADACGETLSITNKNTFRGQAVPHIKTYCRHTKDGTICWFLLTSANLSAAAWGSLQKNGQQLMIRSYELGVLFLPSMLSQFGGCLKYSIKRSAGNANRLSPKSAGDITSTSVSKEEKALSLIDIKIPYVLPPRRYRAEDRPWMIDLSYTKPDVMGRVCGVP